MRLSLAAALLAGLVVAAPANAAPGLGDKVYGATVEPGVTEIEARYGRLVGDEADGEDVLKLEVAHGFSRRFYGALVGEFEREAHEIANSRHFRSRAFTPWARSAGSIRRSTANMKSAFTGPTRSRPSCSSKSARARSTAA